MLNFEKTNCYRVYLGLNDAETKRQEISTEDAMTIVSLFLASHYEGATVYPATGIYKHESGEIVRENSLVIELLYVTDGAIELTVQHFQKVLNQESVMIMKLPVEVQFYK